MSDRSKLIVTYFKNHITKTVGDIKVYFNLTPRLLLRKYYNMYSLRNV